MSLVGRWDWWYARYGTEPFGFDDSPSFALGAAWLDECATVADWGCGGGLLTRFVKPDRYVGVDGSGTWAVDVVADLTDYHERTDGIFMRHVLEHNYHWQQVLANALDAYRRRMVLIIFTPWHDGPEDAHEIQFEAGFDVPTLAFRRDAIESRLSGHVAELVEMESAGAYGIDHVYLIERKVRNGGQHGHADGQPDPRP